MAADAAGAVAKGAAGIAVAGAKAVVDVAQKGIEDLNEFIYKPVFPDEYNSPDYKIPKMIVIKDEASRKGIDVCKGGNRLGRQNRRAGSAVHVRRLG